MRPDHWSVAECLAHLAAWDRFMLTERLPHIREGASLPVGPDAKAFNDAAAGYGRSGVSQLELIEEFVETRKEILEAARSLAADGASITFSIAGNSINLSDYLRSQAEHQLHHQREIESIMS